MISKGITGTKEQVEQLKSIFKRQKAKTGLNDIEFLLEVLKNYDEEVVTYNDFIEFKRDRDAGKFDEYHSQKDMAMGASAGYLEKKGIIKFVGC